MNPGSMPTGGGSTPSVGGSTSGLGGMASGGGGTTGGGFDAKSQAIGQVDNLLGDKLSSTPDIGEKAGLSKKEAKEEAEANQEAAENGEPQDAPSAPTPGEKIGDGKKIDENGNVDKTATRKLIGAAGTAVATYYGGAKGAELASQIDNSKTGNAVLGKVADVADKVPGVEQASEELEGASEAVEGAAAAYTNFKSGNYGEALKNVKKTKDGLKKQKKQIIKRTIMATLLPMAPFALILLFIVVICGPSIGGFNENTHKYDGQMSGNGADPGNGGETDPGTGGQDPGEVVVGDVDNATLQKIIDIAIGELNTLEGSEQWKKYGQSGSWCAAFASYVLKAAGVTGLPMSHSCNSWKSQLISAKRWGAAGSYTSKAGDIVFYDWTHDGVADHVGIVTSASGTELHTIEGNTSDPSHKSNKDGVFAKTRGTGNVIGYAVL